MRQVKMATKAPRLGRGLEALLSEVPSEKNVSLKLEKKKFTCTAEGTTASRSATTTAIAR